MRTDLPKLEQLFEEQVERVLERLRRRASMGFEAELSELMRFHRFLLAAGSSEHEAFAGVNLAEISGTAWSTPHSEWTRQYSRIFEGAVELVGVDEQFLVSLAQVVPYLLNGEDEVMLTPGLVDDILRLGPMLMHVVEEWASRCRAAMATTQTLGSTPPLGGAQGRALASAMPRIVDAWIEALAASRLRLRHSPDRSPETRWKELGDAWSTMSAHLWRTAYCLAVAVWHDDPEGARLFAGALRRWPRGVLHRLSGFAEVRFGRLLMPDLLDLPWTEVLEKVEPLRLPDAPVIDPEGLFAKLVQGAQRDMEVMTAALLTHWTASGRTASALGPRIARALLDRERLEDDDGAPSPQRGLARTTYDLLRLHAAGERHRHGAYGSRLDQALRHLEMITEGPSSPGHFRPSRSLHDRAGLAPVEVALLATSPTGTGGLANDLGELARVGETLPGGDEMLRDAVRRLDGWILALEGGGADVRKGAELLGGWSPEDAAAAAVSLKEGRDTIERVRAQRLRSALVAPERLESLRLAAEGTLRKGGFDLTLFHADAVDVGGGAVAAEPISALVPWNKGNLTEPELAYPVSGSEEIVGRGVVTAIAWETMRGFAARPRTIRETRAWLSDPTFWHLVASLAPKVGPAPSLLIDYRELKLIPFTAFAPGGALAEFDQTFDKTLRPRLQAYGRTVEGVNVFSAPLGEGVAWLFSGDALRRISVADVGDGRLVGIAFQSDQPGTPTGVIDLRMALASEWDESPVLELRHDAPAPVPEPASGTPPPRRGPLAKLRSVLDWIKAD